MKSLLLTDVIFFTSMKFSISTAGAQKCKQALSVGNNLFMLTNEMKLQTKLEGLKGVK